MDCLFKFSIISVNFESFSCWLVSKSVSILYKSEDVKKILITYRYVLGRLILEISKLLLNLVDQRLILLRQCNGPLTTHPDRSLLGGL